MDPNTNGAQSDAQMPVEIPRREFHVSTAGHVIVRPRGPITVYHGEHGHMRHMEFVDAVIEVETHIDNVQLSFSAREDEVDLVCSAIAHLDADQIETVHDAVMQRVEDIARKRAEIEEREHD